MPAETVANCPTAALLTAPTPGAIAIIRLHGESVAIDIALAALTNAEDFPIAAMCLRRFFDDAGAIDSGLVVRLSPTDAHLMPHGGPRVVQRLMSRCAEIGLTIEGSHVLPPTALYPEAADEFEALMLLALSKARSPLAIDLLLDQPRRWRMHATITDEDRARSQRLNRLITPPIVVLAGPANVGKSTLSNALLGRSMSIAIDQPGTTRDYTAGLMELNGLTVVWHDTPGLRETDDPIEREAMALARELIVRADFLIAITDYEHDWPVLPRDPDLHIANKCDAKRRNDAQLNISAVTGDNIAELVRCIRDALVPPSDLAHPGVWVFDERVEGWDRHTG